MSGARAIIGPDFLERPTLLVARELLGCRLCRRTGAGILRWEITETEAYDGPQDRASHAHRGKTCRTEVMFGPSGIWYVYFCYGIHWMLNIVTGPTGYPAAVLIRGAGGISGPARLTKALDIDGKLNQRVADPASGLWIEREGPVEDLRITTSPRIGVNYAGPDWSQRHYRFLLGPSA